MPALPPWVWIVALTATCVVALWKGGPSERYGALVFYGAWIVTRLVKDADRHATQWAVFVVDIAFVLLLAGLALRSDRWWPIFMAAFALLAVVTHAGRIADPHVGSWAYLTAAHIWGYLEIIALGVGTLNRWRERDQLASAGELNAAPGATRR